MLTGGGSGGHIIPILAIASELKRLRPDVRLVYIGQRGDRLADIPARHPAIDQVFTVSAGKFRRYHGEGWRQVLDVGTQALNVRDAFRTLRGIWQSFWLLHRLHPQIIFTRGGFVSVPVALGGRLSHIPYITHDSDSTPSLANRLIASGAVLHAVALPEEFYPYPRSKTRTVGVPVSSDYVPVTQKLQQKYREDLGLSAYRHVLLATGGGNGARQLNDDVLRAMPALLAHYPDLAIVHVAGRTLEQSLSQAYDAALGTADRQRVIIKGFVTDLYRYSGAADVIIARSGASNLAEFAVQAKACVIIPASQLVWAVKHAAALSERHAIVELSEAQAAENGRLATVVSGLLDDGAQRRRLGATLAEFARPDAARQLAMVLLEKAKS